jgi:hypothetical protein
MVCSRCLVNGVTLYIGHMGGGPPLGGKKYMLCNFCLLRKEHLWNTLSTGLPHW